MGWLENPRHHHSTPVILQLGRLEFELFHLSKPCSCKRSFINKICETHRRNTRAGKTEARTDMANMAHVSHFYRINLGRAPDASWLVMMVNCTALHGWVIAALPDSSTLEPIGSKRHTHLIRSLLAYHHHHQQHHVNNVLNSIIPPRLSVVPKPFMKYLLKRKLYTVFGCFFFFWFGGSGPQHTDSNNGGGGTDHGGFIFVVERFVIKANPSRSKRWGWVSSSTSWMKLPKPFMQAPVSRSRCTRHNTIKALFSGTVKTEWTTNKVRDPSIPRLLLLAQPIQLVEPHSTALGSSSFRRPENLFSPFDPDTESRGRVNVL